MNNDKIINKTISTAVTILTKISPVNNTTINTKQQYFPISTNSVKEFLLVQV